MPSKTAQKKSWQRVRSQKRIRQRTKLALMVLGLVIFVVILAQLVHLVRVLFSPWGLPADPKKTVGWNGKFNLNLVVHAKSTSLLSYNPTDKQITIINLPDRTFLEVPGGLGSWQLGAVYDLGKSQNSSGRLLKQTLTTLFALPIDGFLDFSGAQKNKTAEQIVGLMRKNPLSALVLLPDIQSDLTLWELIRFEFGLSAVRFDKIRRLDLEKLAVLENSSLADNTQVLVADFAKLDSAIAVLQDPLIAAEHKTVAVFNATSHPQLANRWARLITNLGANVIITSNATQRLDKTQITGERSLTLQKLQQIFAVNGKISSSFENSLSSRAQINLLVGEDYSN